MGGGLLSEALLLAPDRATLMALLAAMPVALALYLNCRSRAGQIRPAFSLGKLEAIECERAMLLYKKAAWRRQEIHRQREPARGGWRAWWHGRSDFKKRYGQELDELERYARDLRATIIRLRGRPIRRYKSWIHLVSSHSALGRSLGCYSVVLALLAASFYVLEPSWAPADFDTFVLWPGLEGRLLLANWMALSLATAATPLLYVIRRRQMYRQHVLHIRVLSELAATDPDRLMEQRHGDGESPEDAAEAAAENAHEARLAVVEVSNWFDVLGVASSATIDDIRQAYKLLVKQNHPDRVHSMAPAFKQLAEAETKKLNIAYAEALSFFRQDDLAAT
jgi:hypothetical protein